MNSLFLTHGDRRRETSARILCASNLKEIGTGLSLDYLPNDTVLAFDLERHVPKDAERTTGINVLLANGSVTFVTEPTAKSIYAQFAAGLRPIRLPAAATTQPTPNQ